MYTLTTATALDANKAGGDRTVKYEMLTSRYTTVTRGIDMSIAAGIFLQQTERSLNSRYQWYSKFYV